METKKVKIYLTEQIVNEFWRNRENKIKQGIDEFKKFSAKNQFSNLEKSHKNFRELSKALINFKKIHSEILSYLENKTISQQLPADLLINELFTKSDVIKITEENLKNAKKRFDLGNPPGKNNSYGDAINWEVLINNNDLYNKTLYFVTDDKDYYSILEKQKINPFLHKEWKEKKFGEVIICKNFTDFFKLSNIDIFVREEQEKTKLISELKNSGSFVETHYLISKLSKFSYSNQEIREIFEIALTNSQINWLGHDGDVSSFICQLIKQIVFSSEEMEKDSLVDKLIENFDPDKKIVKKELSYIPF